MRCQVIKDFILKSRVQKREEGMIEPSTPFCLVTIGSLNGITRARRLSDSLVGTNTAIH